MYLQLVHVMCLNTRTITFDVTALHVTAASLQPHAGGGQFMRAFGACGMLGFRA